MTERRRESQAESNPDAQQGAAWQRMRIDTSGMMPFTDPVGRMLFGFVIALLMAMMLGMPAFEGAGAWAIFFLLFGLAMVFSACLQVLRNRRFRRDMVRAEDEWQELCRDAHQASTSSVTLTSLLKERGYRDYFVRRWLVAILKEDLPTRTGSELRSSHAVAPPPDAPPDERTWLQLRDQGSQMLPFTNPTLRILIGLLMVAGSLGFSGFNGVVFQWGVFFFVLGLAFGFSGLAQIRRDRRVQRELRRAQVAWVNLRLAAQACSEGGESLARELSKRGYREYFVRRWIVARLQPAPSVAASNE
ncbi:MAG: hypothetical protein ACI89X_000141 [Planctomycetota bacterium]|jgi:hypothetical protein